MLPPHYQQKRTNHQPCLCWYKNATHCMQIIRLRNATPSTFEKVVFPRQRLLFQAPLEQYLDIYICQDGTAQLWDSLPCEHLQVLEVKQPLEPKPQPLSSLSIQQSLP